MLIIRSGVRTMEAVWEQRRMAARATKSARPLAVKPGLKPAFALPTIPALPVAVPVAKWPEWAKAIALGRQPQDQGVGDTVARVIGPVASGAFKTWYFALFRRHCGCEQRQREWNARYPYLTLWSKKSEG